jgi:TetR/AcrR family transcriptional repressor of uid operon
MPRIPKASFEERRKFVIDAAMACFSRKGFHLTTMQEVATEAGVSPGALYTYFNSKEDIIEEAAQERRQSRAIRVETASLLGGAVATLDQVFTDFYQELERDDPASESRIRPQIWADALSNDRIKNILKESWADIITRNTEVIRRGQASGEINPSLDPEAIALLLLCTADGLVLHKLVDSDATNVAAFGDVLRSLLTGQFSTEMPPLVIEETPAKEIGKR